MHTASLSVEFIGKVFALPDDPLGQLAYDYAKAHERLETLVAAHGTGHRNWWRLSVAETNASEAFVNALSKASTPDDHPAWAIVEHEFPEMHAPAAV